MLAPKAIRNQDAELKAISEKAYKALNDKTLSDTEVNAIIEACNREYIKKGGPWGGQIIKRG